MRAIELNLTHSDIPQLIVGLGNIGKDYVNSRHNAGFLFVDAVLEALELKGYTCNFSDEKLYELWSFPKLKLNLLKPKTLMNLSGRAVREYYRYHKPYNSSALFVVHDDLDIALGDFKISAGKGPRLHNGLSSLEQELSTSGFIRVRLGIENRNGLPISGLDYVLYKFTTEELITIKTTIAGILKDRCVI